MHCRCSGRRCDHHSVYAKHQPSAHQHGEFPVGAKGELWWGGRFRFLFLIHAKISTGGLLTSIEGKEPVFLAENLQQLNNQHFEKFFLVVDIREEVTYLMN